MVPVVSVGELAGTAREVLRPKCPEPGVVWRRAGRGKGEERGESDNVGAHGGGWEAKGKAATAEFEKKVNVNAGVELMNEKRKGGR